MKLFIALGSIAVVDIISSCWSGEGAPVFLSIIYSMMQNLIAASPSGSFTHELSKISQVLDIIKMKINIECNQIEYRNKNIGNSTCLILRCKEGYFNILSELCRKRGMVSIKDNWTECDPFFHEFDFLHCT